MEEGIRNDPCLIGGGGTLDYEVMNFKVVFVVWYL
jgi:hypothetical protein